LYSLERGERERERTRDPRAIALYEHETQYFFGLKELCIPKKSK
jgi:hypothetical protein